MRFLNSTRTRRALVLAVLVSVLFSVLGIGAAPVSGGDPGTTVSAVSGGPEAPAKEQGGHGEDFAKVLLVLLLILVAAKTGGELFERLGQPAVLGELLFGMLLGNLSLLKLHALEEFVIGFVRDPATNHFITTFAEIGVVLLLFEVGLESTVGEMLSVGVSSLVVAVVGVIAPMGLGYLVSGWFLSGEPWTVHLFVGTVLAATSVGITARVLNDLKRMNTREAKIILGAAVIDDILGLIVLAVVQGVVAASNSGIPMKLGAVILIVVKALAFFVLAIAVGRLVSKRLYRWATYLQVRGVLLSLTLGWCFLIAYLGTVAGLAPIVGAFAAGLVLEEATFRDWVGREQQLEELLRPITTFFVPVFFVHMGMQVDLSVFGQVSVLGFAAALTLAAVIGKQACSFGVMERGLNRKAIGFGMIPRGEVGLIVASIGATMKTAEGHPLINGAAFSATVIMVVVTTMITPPILKWALEHPGTSKSA